MPECKECGKDAQSGVQVQGYGWLCIACFRARGDTVPEPEARP